MPPWFLDFLLTFNITFAILILMLAVYVRSPLELAVFPSLLLVTTLYRLALNLASTNLILLNAVDAEGNPYLQAAGDVIRVFGDLVAGQNPVVGFIVFVILIAIQYIVDSLSFFRQLQVLHCHQLCDRETIMHFSHGNFFRWFANSSFVIRALRSYASGLKIGTIPTVVTRLCPIRYSQLKSLNRNQIFLPNICRNLRRCYDCPSGTITDSATIKKSDRFCNVGCCYGLLLSDFPLQMSLRDL